MSYVTQGTIQVERKTKDAVESFINPTTDYAVKHNEKGYIVFVNAESPPKSRLFERKKNGLTIEGFTENFGLFRLFQEQRRGVSLQLRLSGGGR
jgi:hypothetical protein